MNAIVQHLEATTPVYDVRQVTCHRASCARRRRRVGLVMRPWAAVSVAVGILAGWGAGEGRAPSWDAYAGVRPEPTILGLTVTHITNLGLDIPADAR